MLHVSTQGQLKSFAFRPVTKNTYNKIFFNTVPNHILYLEWLWQGILNVPVASCLGTVDEAERPEKYRIGFPASKKFFLRHWLNSALWNNQALDQRVFSFSSGVNWQERAANHSPLSTASGFARLETYDSTVRHSWRGACCYIYYLTNWPKGTFTS
jgi:hypothetical protein